MYFSVEVIVFVNFLVENQIASLSVIRYCLFVEIRAFYRTNAVVISILSVWFPFMFCSVCLSFWRVFSSSIFGWSFCDNEWAVDSSQNRLGSAKILNTLKSHTQSCTISPVWSLVCCRLHASTFPRFKTIRNWIAYALCAVCTILYLTHNIVHCTLLHCCRAVNIKCPK